MTQRAAGPQYDYLSQYSPVRGTKLEKVIMGMFSLVRKLLNLGDLKESAELHFQTQWAREFASAPDQVLDYWQQQRHLSKIVDTAPISEESKVLDVGCGISTVLHFLPGKRHGIDPLADSYRQLYDYPEGIAVSQAHGEDIPFPDANFNFVFCSNVLDHTSNPTRVVAEIARVLEPGGYFILTVELNDEDEKRDPAHPHNFSRDSTLALVEGDFELLWEESSPWIGLRRWCQGKREFKNYELILMLRRKLPASQ